jgi:hypothetical protein
MLHVLGLAQTSIRQSPQGRFSLHKATLLLRLSEVFAHAVHRFLLRRSSSLKQLLHLVCLLTLSAPSRARPARARRLPVVEGGQLIGGVAIGFETGSVTGRHVGNFLRETMMAPRTLYRAGTIRFSCLSCLLVKLEEVSAVDEESVHDFVDVAVL